MFFVFILVVFYFVSQLLNSFVSCGIATKIIKGTNIIDVTKVRNSIGNSINQLPNNKLMQEIVG
jgi:hypothetical protein